MHSDTFFGFKFLRSLLTISPAFESTLSGVDITGTCTCTHKRDLAITAITGKRDSLFFYHSSSFVDLLRCL